MNIVFLSILTSWFYEVPRRIPRSLNGDECGVGYGERNPPHCRLRCPTQWAGQFTYKFTTTVSIRHEQWAHSIFIKG